MTKKLDSVRRSLFRECEDDDSLEKLCKDSKRALRTSINPSNGFIATAVLITVFIAILSKLEIQKIILKIFPKTQ